LRALWFSRYETIPPLCKTNLLSSFSLHIPPNWWLSAYILETYFQLKAKISSPTLYIESMCVELREILSPRSHNIMSFSLQNLSIPIELTYLLVGKSSCGRRPPWGLHSWDLCTFVQMWSKRDRSQLKYSLMMCLHFSIFQSRLLMHFWGPTICTKKLGS